MGTDVPVNHEYENESSLEGKMPGGDIKQVFIAMAGELKVETEKVKNQQEKQVIR